MSMRTLIQALSVFCCLALLGCESTTTDVSQSSTNQLLDDTVFPDFHLYSLETDQEVFALSEDAKAFVHNIKSFSDDPTKQMEALVDAIFDHSELDLLYMGDANTVAAETFANRAANCLSMSIMTYAMAHEAGFTARFQEIDIPEYWTRRDGFSLLNGHINLRIIPRDDANVIKLLKASLQVDFDPQRRLNYFPTRYIERTRVLAMFYNNKGADALLANSYSKAYAYFRKALTIAPDFEAAWVNLGLLYRFNNYHRHAERSYKQAMSVNTNSLTAWENLAYLYEIEGRLDESQAILTRIETQRKDNPYYHFIQGEQAFDEEEFDQALKHYREALKRDKTRHEIYFGLAKVHYQLGNIKRSERYLQLAARKSSSRHEQQKYQGKLDLLTRNNLQEETYR